MLINLLFQETSSAVFFLYCFYFRQELSRSEWVTVEPSVFGNDVRPHTKPGINLTICRDQYGHIFLVNNRLSRKRFCYYISASRQLPMIKEEELA